MSIDLVEYLKTPLVYLTQSLWRDEAFSYVLAKNSLINIIRLSTQDFNPPLYYLLLHFWMKIFGNTEVAMRTLSFIFYLLTCYVVYKFISRALSHHLGFFALFLAFFNPMLLYFSFEARMYSMLAFFSAASIYCYYFKNWRLWFLFSLMGLYTHLFFWFTILVQFIFRRSYVKFVGLVACYIPWIPVVLVQLHKGSQGFWVNRIDVQLVKSSLGNIFTSYEGTPGGLWAITAVVSFLIVVASYFVLKKKRDEFTKISIIWLYVPLVTIIFISLWKPLFVNRYLIFLVIPMVFILTRVIEMAKKFEVVVFSMLLIFEISVFLFLGPHYRKVDIRESVRRAVMQMGNNDVLASKTPLTFFEVNYYSGFKSYLYAPDKSLIPDYVGKALIDENKILPNFNNVEGKAFLINDDGSVVVW